MRVSHLKSSKALKRKHDERGSLGLVLNKRGEWRLAHRPGTPQLQTLLQNVAQIHVLADEPPTGGDDEEK